MDRISFTDIVLLWILIYRVKSGGEICKAMNKTIKVKQVEALKTRSSPRSSRRKVE